MTSEVVNEHQSQAFQHYYYSFKLKNVPDVCFHEGRHGQDLQMGREFEIRGNFFPQLSASSHAWIFSYRESCENECSAQTNCKAGTLWDDSTSSACWTRLETNQPAQIPGEE